MPRLILTSANLAAYPVIGLLRLTLRRGLFRFLGLILDVDIGYFAVDEVGVILAAQALAVSTQYSS